MIKIGLVINPIAGIGGPGAFKGSDGSWQEALKQGYAPQAKARAVRFLRALDASITTVPGAMGMDAVDDAGLTARCLLVESRFELGKTSPDDTARAAKALAGVVDLIVFVGGDGTAAAVAKGAGQTPCLGVPAGVKITSAVFAHDVEEATWLVNNLAAGFQTAARDVTDVDEEAYRAGRLEVRLVASLRVPLSPAVQGGKVATTAETPLEPLVEMVLRDWDDAIHVVGPGSVMHAIKGQFWGTPALLGFDVIDGNRIVANDVDDRALLALVDTAARQGRPLRVWLSPIGGQGMLLGRGTQVLRPAFLRAVGWDALRVVAPPEKLLGLPGLYVDTGDEALDGTAPKHVRVVSGWNETRLMRVLRGPATP